VNAPLWQIKIEEGQYMAGLHTFRSKQTAVAWASNWLRARSSFGGLGSSARLLKDGKQIALLSINKKEAS